MGTCNDADHKNTRKRLLPLAYGKPCPFCGFVMLKGQKLDLDHATPRMLGGAKGPRRIAHAHCNRSAGARLGNAFRSANRLQTSRRW
jgi:hypothetical protein